MKNFKNIAKSLVALIGANYLISKKSAQLINATMLYTGLFCLLSVTIFSCTKDSSYPLRHPLPATASLMIVQGASTLSNDEIFLSLDNIPVSNQPFKYGAHTSYIYGSAVQVVQLQEHGPGVLTYVGLASDTVLLNAPNSYSLFFSPAPPYTVSTGNPQPNFTLLTDSLSQPAAGQAKIRFVNVSPGAGPVDLVLNGNVLVANKTNGGYSSFIPVNPTTENNFEVRENGSSVVLSTLKNVEIRSGGIYTIWLYGPSSNPQGTGLTLGIITNKQY